MKSSFCDQKEPETQCQFHHLWVFQNVTWVSSYTGRDGDWPNDCTMKSVTIEKPLWNSRCNCAAKITEVRRSNLCTPSTKAGVSFEYLHEWFFQNRCDLAQRQSQYQCLMGRVVQLETRNYSALSALFVPKQEIIIGCSCTKYILWTFLGG